MRWQRGLFSTVRQGSLLVVLAATSCTVVGDDDRGNVQRHTSQLTWSREPPGGLARDRVPQFVAVTFDDNFSAGGMNWATNVHMPLMNPAGNGRAATFDGTPARTSFYFTSMYVENSDGNRTAWRRAVMAAHEAADHTRTHPQGNMFGAAQWLAEIKSCKDRITDPQLGIGVPRADVIGFRAPFLGYNQEMFNVLVAEGFRYDTSIQNCWAETEDGTNCSWPYTLDSGSPDATVLTQKYRQPVVTAAAGFWEVPVSALVIPPDAMATRYNFPPGLRGRVPTNLMPPNFFELASGKIAPMDITLFVNALLTAPEVLAILKYNLDLHLQGNRAPLVFVAHSHVYDGSYTAATRAPMAAERQQVIAQFLSYALAQPAVRVRPVRDIVAWMANPTPLDADADGGAERPAPEAAADAASPADGPPAGDGAATDMASEGSAGDGPGAVDGAGDASGDSATGAAGGAGGAGTGGSGGMTPGVRNKGDSGCGCRVPSRTGGGEATATLLSLAVFGWLLRCRRSLRKT